MVFFQATADVNSRDVCVGARKLKKGKKTLKGPRHSTKKGLGFKPWAFFCGVTTAIMLFNAQTSYLLNHSKMRSEIKLDERRGFNWSKEFLKQKFLFSRRSMTSVKCSQKQHDWLWMCQWKWFLDLIWSQRLFSCDFYTKIKIQQWDHRR